MTDPVRLHPRDLQAGDTLEIDGTQWTVKEVFQHPTLRYWHVSCIDDKPSMTPFFTFGDDDVIDTQRSKTGA